MKSFLKVFTVFALAAMLFSASACGKENSANKYAKYNIPEQNVLEFNPRSITFGSYEQDNDHSNGREPIEWYVLSEEDGKMLVVSRYILAAKKINEDVEDVTGETSDIRKWLNNDFFGTAFSPEEQAKIIETELENLGNNGYDIPDASNTLDKVFLLSWWPEVMKYLPSNTARQAYPTEYAKAGGVYTEPEIATGWWWLRTTGETYSHAVSVHCGGIIGYNGNHVNHNNVGIRPALWLPIE